jgi:hypothetical protein
MDPAQKGMTRIVVELPDDIAKRLESAWRDVSRGTLKAIALEAYRDGTLSREQVGRVLDARRRRCPSYCTRGWPDVYCDR